ncbi:MAG: hypothetical protein LBG76_06980 [Treponema sp.]|jgi:dTMP kinase|nr:hypothetical protein [Treponema sp.]
MIIAVDGIDGTGKGTQCGLLRAALEGKGKQVRIASFPCYASFFGEMISEYLNGAYGSLYAVNPKLIALLFAMDRKDFFEKYEPSQDNMLILDRYVLSNMAHQGVKLPAPERSLFFEWLKNLEYGVNRIPYPDISLVLDMDAALSVKNVAKKERRSYTSQTYDLHEKDAAYLQDTRALFLELAGRENAALIRCDDGNGNLKKEETIASEIAETVLNRLDGDAKRRNIWAPYGC